MGWVALLAAVVSAMGGAARLFSYSEHPAHKFTARAMMHGALNLRRGLLGVGHDEQIFNGAGYTNWGFGVPLLQIPFHAIALLFRKRFAGAPYFPDRAIFLFYTALALPILWTGIRRMLYAPAPANGDRAVTTARTVWGAMEPWVVSWSLTMLVVAFTLGDLTSYRFIVYEETIAYFVLFELLAVGCYAHWLTGRRLAWAAAAAFAAATATLIRPTGAPYMLVWLPLLWLERRDARTALTVLSAAAPPLVFWLYSNWARCGAFLSPGFQNALPAYYFHFSMQRFGSVCNDSARHTADNALAMLRMLFIGRPDTTPAQAGCGFLFEKRIYDSVPFLSPVALLVMVLDLGGWVFSRPRKASELLPHLGFALVFFLYLSAGAGLSYRYAGDFWPLVVLIGLQGLRRADLGRASLAPALAFACVFFAYVRFEQDIWPALRTLNPIPAARMSALAADYEHTEAQAQPAVDATIACGASLPNWLRADGVGWFPDCAVGPATNLYVGLPKGGGRGRYRLRLEADFAGPDVRVMFNGALYVAHWNGDAYIADLRLDPSRFHTPVAMLTIQWSRNVASERLRPVVHLRRVTLETA